MQEMDDHTLVAYYNYRDKHKDKFASGEFSFDSKDDHTTRKLDIGIRDTLYGGKLYSAAHMHRGEVTAILDMMMNTKSYREKFREADPERFNIYQLAYHEFVNKEIDDAYINPETKKFDPESKDYDYDTALAHGMGPKESGENKGHWGSVAPASPEDKKKYNLGDEAYMMLKGAGHDTFNLGIKGEEERGFTVKKFGDRYYSIKKPEEK